MFELMQFCWLLRSFICWCYIPFNSRLLLLLSLLLFYQLAIAPNSSKKRRAVSASRVCSQLATALCAYAEHLCASSLHIAVPKGHKEYAAWMRSCLYVGLKVISYFFKYFSIVENDFERFLRKIMGMIEKKMLFYYP